MAITLTIPDDKATIVLALHDLSKARRTKAIDARIADLQKALTTALPDAVTQIQTEIARMNALKDTVAAELPVKFLADSLKSYFLAVERSVTQQEAEQTAKQTIAAAIAARLEELKDL